MSLAPVLPRMSAEAATQLSLREKIGQLVMFAVGGQRLTEHERDVIRSAHLGGMILFSRNYDNRDQLTTLTDQIQRAARRGNSLQAGALIAVDQEGGVVKRFPDMPPRYSAPEMGEIGKATVAYDQGRATGRALRNHGVNVNLAPVADLDIGPNHTMKERSFGSNEDRVARLVRAFMEGLQDKRVAATAKHFPGFGGATINSDFGKAYIRRSRWQLRHIDAEPFHRAVGGGLRMMMISHGIYVHDGGSRPASINRSIATERLRKGFGFTGVAVSDDLVQLGWKLDVGRACQATIKAGVDIALITGGVDMAETCAGHIYRAVRRGEISRRRIDQAVARVLDLKRWLRVYQ